MDLDLDNWDDSGDIYVREFITKSASYKSQYQFCCVLLYCVCVFIAFKLKVISYNVHGVKNSSDTLQKMTTDYDIILVQEHWLFRMN